MIYTNSDVAHVIDEYIHSERGRAIAKRRLIDGITIEQLAKEFDRDPRTMQRTVAKLQAEIFLHIK